VNQPAVTCSNCGTVINEPTDQPIDQRKPCPKCGSTARNISVTASERLQMIDTVYAQKTAASDRRIDDIIGRSTKVYPTTATGTGTAHDATVTTEHSAVTPLEGTALGHSNAQATITTGEVVALTGELVREQGRRTVDAITTLIQTVTVGQSEAAKTGEKLTDLTHELVIWTRVIGAATIVAVIVAIVAVVRAG
jgi:hypothetical protein